MVYCLGGVISYRPYQAIIAEAQANNSTQSIVLNNNTGSTIVELTPVSIDSVGELELIDVSSDSLSISAIGVASEDILDATSGSVVTSGRIFDITTTYNQGDYLYVSKTGGLTNIIPSIGIDGFVSGDSVIRVGVIVKNSTTPAQKDLLVKFELVGKL